VCNCPRTASHQFSATLVLILNAIVNTCPDCAAPTSLCTRAAPYIAGSAPHTPNNSALHASMSRRRIPGYCFQHLCPARSPRRPGQYGADGHLADDYPKQHLINSFTPGYTGATHFPTNDVVLTHGNRQLSTEDAESALLEAAKAGVHEAVDSSTLEDSSLPALMTEI